MKNEYLFDYKKAKSNRFADQIKKDDFVVVLDQDIAEVFRTSEAVNNILRSLITMPKDSSKLTQPLVKSVLEGQNLT